MATPNPFDEIFGITEPDNEFNDPEYPIKEPEKPPEVAPEVNPFDAIFGIEPPEPEPMVAPPEEMGTVANLWAGLRERGAELIGNLAGGLQTYGESETGGLGGIVHRGGFDLDYLSPEEWKKYSEEGGRMGLEEIRDDWANISYGFTPSAGENWEILKGEAGLWDKAQAAAAFALETGVISLADMAGAVAVPPAYILSRAEEISQERAVQQGRPGQPSTQDKMIGLAAGALIQAMERFGFERIADAWTKGGPALQRILTAGVSEAATEAVQEPLEFAAETYGTPTEEAMTAGEYGLALGERSAQGALGGGPAGAVLATPPILLEQAGMKEPTISPDVKSTDENRNAVTRALNERAMQMEQEQVIQDERTMLEEEQQAAEMAIQREADEIDAQDTTYKSAAHAELKLQQLEKKYGETRLFPSQMKDGVWILEPYGPHSARKVMAEREERLGVGLRPAETGQIEVTEGEQVVATEPAPTTEGIEVGEEITATEPAPTTEGIEVTELPPYGGDLIPEPTARRIPVTEETAEEVIATEPAPTTEGIEVEEITPEEVGEAIPQIGVEELTPAEAGIEEIEVSRKIYPGRKKPPPDDEGPGGGGAPVGGGPPGGGPIMPSIVSGEIAKGRRPRRGIDAEITETEAQLAQIPTNINIDEQGADVLMDQAHKLRIQRRDLMDEKQYRITPEEAKQARKELWERLRKAGESVNRYETIEEMRARLGRIAIARPSRPKKERPSVFEGQENLGTGTEAYLDELPGLASMEEDVYNYRGTKIELEPDGENQIRIANLEAETMQEGAGTRAMTILTELADKHGVDISLEPVSFAIGGGVMSNEQLSDWYRRFGFEFDPEYENTMFRRAGAEEEVVGETPLDMPAEEAAELETPTTTSTDVLPDGTEYDLSHTKDTQVPNTVGTYDKANAEYFEDIDNGDILDYGAGMGLAAKKYGFESLEPYPTGWEPDYFTADQIDRKYDGIIMNNVLNVLPSHTRHVVLADAAKRKLAPGGRMYINVRSRGDVMSQRNTAKKVFSESEILTQRDTYQKGYQRAELIKYLERELGPDYTVESAKFGSVAVLVTKKGTAKDTVKKGPTSKEEASAELQKMAEEARAKGPWEPSKPEEFEGRQFLTEDGWRWYEYPDGTIGDHSDPKFQDLGYANFEEFRKFWEADEFYQLGDTVGEQRVAKKWNRVRRDFQEFAEEGEREKYNAALNKQRQIQAESESTKLAAEAMAEVDLEGREDTDADAQVAAFNFIESNPAFVGTRLSHKPGDERYGVTLTHYYGDQDNTEGADGDPVDVILSKDFEIGKEYPIFIASLVDLKTGDFEQHKVLAGFKNMQAAQAGVQEMYPDQVQEISFVEADDYTVWRNSPRTQQPFDPDTFKTDIQKAQDLRKPAEGDTTLDPTNVITVDDDAARRSPWILADGSIVDNDGSHMDYVLARGVEADSATDARAINRMQLESQGIRSAFFYDNVKKTSIIWLHVHEDQTLTDAQIKTIETFTKAERKAGRKPSIMIGSTPTQQPDKEVELPQSRNISLAALKREWGERKAKYRAAMDKFYAGLAEKSAKYARAAGLRQTAALRPDPTKDDIIVFIRKHGGLNVNIGGDWRGQLSHLNEDYRYPGLPSIEQNNGTGLSMDQAAEIAWEGNYIREYDADMLADLLERAQDGTKVYSDQNTSWADEQWAEQQAEYEEQMEAEAKADAEYLVEQGMPEDLGELMALAAQFDKWGTEDIVSREVDEDVIKQQLQDLINERKAAIQTTGPEAEEGVPVDAGVEAEAPKPEGAEPVREVRGKPAEEPVEGDYDYISEYPWQELAAYHDVEILEPPTPSIEGPRTFVIDVYSDLKRTKFVRRIYAANFFRLRDVEQAVLGRRGPFKARLQERDEFLTINKISYEDYDGHHTLIEEVRGPQNKPYEKIEPIKRIEDKRAGERKKERQRREAGWLTPEQWGSTVDRYHDDLMAEPDPRDVVKHWGEEKKRKGTPRNYISHAEGKAKIEEWKAHARSQGGNSSRVILSLFDDSGAWAQPWIDAGYDVRAIDLKRDDVDIMDIDYGWLLDMGFLDGEGIWGILAACPCTTFATPAAQDWGYAGTPRPLNEGGMDFIGKTHKSVDLVNQTLAIIEFLKPRFWALENPVGRIRKITGVPDPLLSFNPSNYGDPYTKQTQIYGHFNANLPTAKVDPRKEYGGEGSRAHNLSSKDELDGGLRSITPDGFAYAFFMANNDQDNPVVDEIVQKEYVRTIPEEAKEGDPDIERKVELVAKLALLDGTYPTANDEATGMIDAYYLEETDNWPNWAKLLIEEAQEARQDDWRIDTGNVATVRELNHLDQELRELLKTGQRKTTKYPQKPEIDAQPIQSLNELEGPYIDEDFDIIDPYMMEAAVEGVNIAIGDLAEQGYTYTELRGEPNMELPNSLRDPMDVIQDIASGAIPVAKGLRQIKNGHRRTKPANVLDRLHRWNTRLENAIGQQAMTSEQFKEHVYEEYPYLAQALDASYGDDDGMAMRRQVPDELRADMYERMGRDDLAWAPIEPAAMPEEEGRTPKPEQPQEALPGEAPTEAEPGPDLGWQPVEQLERPPEVDIDGVLDASATGEGTALTSIPLTATDGERSVTHNAQWWKNAIDDRLKKLNKLRGCA